MGMINSNGVIFGQFSLVHPCEGITGKSSSIDNALESGYLAEMSSEYPQETHLNTS
jgi:hypothetical protein